MQTFVAYCECFEASSYPQTFIEAVRVTARSERDALRRLPCDGRRRRVTAIEPLGAPAWTPVARDDSALAWHRPLHEAASASAKYRRTFARWMTAWAGRNPAPSLGA